MTTPLPHLHQPSDDDPNADPRGDPGPGERRAGGQDDPAVRRLRVIEIAVLADDRELRRLCDDVCALLGLEPGSAQHGPPASLNCYDGADLPRSMAAELIADIGYDEDTKADDRVTD